MWGDELTKIRRMLRDPDGAIWSEPILRHLWNDVQQDLQHKTSVLEDVEAQRVPASFQFAYQQEWEYRYLPSDQSQFYQCLSQHDDNAFCFRWETQQVAGIAADVADYGIQFTQPWEAFMSETPGMVVKMRFPHNFNTMKFIAYDQNPIDAVSRKQVQSSDPSHMTHEGEPIAYYPYDEADNSYVLYPRPSTAFVHEVDGEGVALFAEDDTEDTDEGTIAVRTGSTDSGELGAALDIIDTVDSVFMVYDVSPADMLAASDEPDYPDFLRKYVRHGVVSRAYGANTDGRIRSLSDYWGMRYTLGIQFIKRYMSNRRVDRDYRLTSGAIPGRSRRHPRLPDRYPASYP